MTNGMLDYLFRLLGLYNLNSTDLYVLNVSFITNIKQKVHHTREYQWTQTVQYLHTEYSSCVVQ